MTTQAYFCRKRSACLTRGNDLPLKFGYQSVQCAYDVKRLPDRPRQPLDLATEPNRCWALDFMHDALYCGRRFWTLNVIDEAKDGLNKSV